MAKENVVREKSFGLAIRIVRLYKFLCEEKKEFVLSKQVLRSGTSIGANVREADNAESKADFIHKMGIAQKEADETLYWLELLKETSYMTDGKFSSLYSEAEEVIKLIKRIIITAKQNAHR
ncbi:MAG: four helix bundle protein [Ignavibacteriales bacterium]|nr:four helix bundle protein [Ignavibacteriales bacterium]